MKTSVKKLPHSKIELEIELSPDEFSDFFKKAQTRMAQNFQAKGFRKGKAPIRIMEREIGPESILAQGADLAIEESYAKALKENNLQSISNPEVSVQKLALGSPFIFRASFAILPEMKLPEYRSIASRERREKVSLNSQETSDALNWLVRSRAKFIAKNEAAQKGDFVEVTYWIREVDASAEAKEQKDAFVLGEASFLPGFEDQLIGMRSGQEKENIFLTVPLNHSIKEMAGKKLKVKARINSVQIMEKPLPDDQFAKNLGNFTGLEALKKNIEEGLLQEKNQAESQRLRSEILGKITTATSCEVPLELARQEQQKMIHDLRHDLREHLKITFEEYLSRIKKSQQELEDSLLKEGESKVKNFLILRAIAAAESIEIPEDEVEEETNKTIKHYDSIDGAKKKIDLGRLKEYTRSVLVNEKVFQLLESLAQS